MRWSRSATPLRPSTLGLQHPTLLSLTDRRAVDQVPIAHMDGWQALSEGRTAERGQWQHPLACRFSQRQRRLSLTKQWHGHSAPLSPAMARTVNPL
jgi:hypothetical protein